MKQFGLSKKERIKSKKEFELVFSSGEILFSSNQNFKAVFQIQRKTEQAVLQAAFAVSRKAGIAVWRNKVKRLMRESFRLNKEILLSSLNEKKSSLQIIFLPNTVNQRRFRKIFLSQVMPDFIDMMNQLKAKL